MRFRPKVNSRRGSSPVSMTATVTPLPPCVPFSGAVPPTALTRTRPERTSVAVPRTPTAEMNGYTPTTAPAGKAAAAPNGSAAYSM